ncbi:MAG TPA: SIS domain-containing protein [Steroidobacteraceae bacterium]
MDVLGLSAALSQANGAYWTAREIAQQPQLWREIAQLVASDAALAGFLGQLRTDEPLRVVLTGAGTSSFIGECLAPALARRGWSRAEAVASTDIVASPASFLVRDTPTLMVHFARSGNSPESVAALALAEQCIDRCYHLIVTCNDQGELYRRAGAMRHAHAVLLPQASNDQGFAMTSSFTGMLLAAGAALQVLPMSDARAALLSGAGTRVLHSCEPLLTSLVQARFARVVYLGSKELKGLAREAALKMLELTDGRVIAIADSPLGFRHGPKTILNGGTLVVVFLSNDEHARRYEVDLLTELRRDAVAGRVIALAGREDGGAHADTLVLSEDAVALSDLELCLPYAVFAQVLGMLYSMSLGLSPDNPNAAGTVNRVVQGVSIYPYGRTP